MSRVNRLQNIETTVHLIVTRRFFGRVPGAMKKLTTLKSKKPRQSKSSPKQSRPLGMTIRSITTLVFAITRSWKPDSLRLLLNDLFPEKSNGCSSQAVVPVDSSSSSRNWLPSYGTRSQRQGTRILPKATSPSRPRCRLGGRRYDRLLLSGKV